MTTFTRTYPTEAAARRAVAALRATGVAERDITLLAGSARRDIRLEPVGGFAGPVAPETLVGTYGNRPVLRRHGAGAFAGDPDRQRQGSYADTDRIAIVTYDADAERARITGIRGARRLLHRATLPADFVDRTVDGLQTGHAVVLVDLSETADSHVYTRLELLARAA